MLIPYQVLPPEWVASCRRALTNELELKGLPFLLTIGRVTIVNNGSFDLLVARSRISIGSPAVRINLAFAGLNYAFGRKI
jgi:hypothetical protein